MANTNKRFSKEYLEYITSEKWYRIRTNKLELNPECEMKRELLPDGSGQMRNIACRGYLQVHHLRYPKVLGTETMKDLQTVCQRHHVYADKLRKGQLEMMTDLFSYLKANTPKVPDITFSFICCPVCGVASDTIICDCGANKVAYTP